MKTETLKLAKKIKSDAIKHAEALGYNCDISISPEILIKLCEGIEQFNNLNLIGYISCDAQIRLKNGFPVKLILNPPRTTTGFIYTPIYRLDK